MTEMTDAEALVILKRLESLLAHVKDKGVAVGEYNSDTITGQCCLVGYAKKDLGVDADAVESAEVIKEIMKAFRQMGFNTPGEVVNYNDGTSVSFIKKRLIETINMVKYSRP